MALATRGGVALTIAHPQCPVPAGDGTPRCAVVGRGGEIERIRTALQRCPVEGAEVLLFEGEPGIGKSVMAGVALQEAASANAIVLTAHADELAGRRTLGVIAEALSGHAPGLDLSHGIAAGGASDGQHLALRSATLPDLDFQASEVAIAALEEITSQGPCALVLEDLHWADASSLYVLRRVLRHCRSLPLALIATFRPLPRPADLAHLIDDAGPVAHIRLGPLAPTDLEALVRQAIGATPTASLLSELGRAGGNPLLALESLAALRAADALRFGVEGPDRIVTADLVRSLPATTLKASVLGRVRLLSPEALDRLRLGAVLGTAFRPEDLALVTGRPVGQLVGPLTEAVAAGLLAEEHGRLVFRHELVRAALYEDIPGVVRTALHRDAASRLALGGAPAAQLAEHLLRGATVGDAAGARALATIARGMAETAPAVAADLLERTLTLVDRPGPLAADLLADLAIARLWSGQVAEGEAACRRSLATLSDPAQRLGLHHVLAASLMHRGQADAVLREVAAGLAEACDDERARCRLRALGAMAELFVGHVDQAASDAEALTLEAERLGDAATAVRALVTRFLVAQLRGNLGEATRAARAALALADRDGTREAHDSLPHLPVGMCLIDTDRFDDAVAVLTQGLVVQEAFGSRGVLSIYHVVLGFAHFWAGRWDAAAAEIETGTRLAEETGAGWQAGARSLGAIIAMGRGDEAAWRGSLRAAETDLGAGEAGYRVAWRHLAAALARDLTRDVPPALTSAVEALTADPFALPTVAPTLVRVALRTGDRAMATRLRDRLAALLSGEEGAVGVGAALCHADALIAGEAARMGEAADRFRQAGRPFEQALAAEDSAVSHALGHDRTAASARAQEAARIYRSLGAVAFRRHLEERLAAAGVTLEPGRTMRHRPVRGFGALTATERRILRMVAERRSNPEIASLLGISRRTVETHVSNVLAKVDLRSRVELARAAAEHFGWQLRLVGAGDDERGP